MASHGTGHLIQNMKVLFFLISFLVNHTITEDDVDGYFIKNTDIQILEEGNQSIKNMLVVNNIKPSTGNSYLAASKQVRSFKKQLLDI